MKLILGSSSSDTNKTDKLKKGLKVANISIIISQHEKRPILSKKKSRITRKFAESLTENEVYERFKKVGEENRLKMQKQTR